MEDLQSIGFMFDACRARYNTEIELSKDVVLQIESIGDDPGHVQSGQYLWPAAKSAALHLIENWAKFNSKTVIELGAGCGLTGLAAACMSEVEVVVLTDYDNGSLSILENNVQQNGLATNCSVHHLEWGKKMNFVHNNINLSKFGLVLGSDLIYCLEVVEPLFTSVEEFLKENGVFLLATSFSLDEDTETKIDSVCDTLKINRQLIIQLDVSQNISKIEYYTHKQ